MPKKQKHHSPGFLLGQRWQQLERLPASNTESLAAHSMLLCHYQERPCQPSHLDRNQPQCI